MPTGVPPKLPKPSSVSSVSQGAEPAEKSHTPATKQNNDGRAAIAFMKEEGESDRDAIARAALDPCLQAAGTASNWSRRAVGGFPDVTSTMKELAKQGAKVSANDLSRLEAMLTAQAHVLDAVFNDCAVRALANRNEFPEAFDRYLRLAFKAQSQCRTTVEALAEIKNPRPFIAVDQANVAHGPQQVNNGQPPARAREKSNPGNELLEHKADVTWLDQGAPRVAGAKDSPMAPLAEIDRPAHPTGKGSVKPERDEARHLRAQAARADAATRGS